MSYSSSPLPALANLADETLRSIESADMVKELTGFDDITTKRLIRYFGVSKVERSPVGGNSEGYAIDGNRTVLLVTVEGVVKGFVHDPTASGPLILPRSAERPLKQLERLLNQKPDTVGFSESVHTIRLHSGVYQILLRQIVQDIVSGERLTEHIDNMVSTYLQGCPVLPTPYKLLQILDPGWTRDGDRLFRDDVFTSQLSSQLVAQRWAVLNKGRVLLRIRGFGDTATPHTDVLTEDDRDGYFARVPQPFWRYLLRLYFVKLCSPAMYEFVEMVGAPEYPAVDEVEKQIKREFSRLGRKRKASFDALGYAKEVTLASAPPCIHRALHNRLDNMARFNLAVILNEIVSQRRMAVEPLLETMIAALSHENKHRAKDLRARVVSEIKNVYGKTDKIFCRSRHANFSGIKCVYSGPHGCGNRPGAEKLDKNTVTIAKYWNYTDAPEGVDSVDEASRSSAPSDWEVDSVI